MNPRLPYGKRMIYPHMKPADVAIWERFMAKFPDAYTEVIYDQPVGTGANIPPDAQPDVAAGFKVLTQWKIDAIGYTTGHADVLEIKPAAGLSAVGQVRGYAHLVDDIDELTLPVNPVIVTDVLRPDMERVAADQGVKIIVV